MTELVHDVGIAATVLSSVCSLLPVALDEDAGSATCRPALTPSSSASAPAVAGSSTSVRVVVPPITRVKADRGGTLQVATNTGRPPRVGDHVYRYDGDGWQRVGSRESARILRMGWRGETLGGCAGWSDPTAFHRAS